MKLVLVTYEELRTRHFTEQMKEHEDNIKLIRESGASQRTKEEQMEDEGMKVQFYRDALAALNWIKIEYDEEGKLVSFPEEGEEALFSDKRGNVYIDEVCSELTEDGRMCYLDATDISDIVAWMPLPKPFKYKGSE